MNDLISVITDKCVGCGACVRACPAPEANVFKFLEGGRKVVEVNDDKCIVCGKCLHACQHNARDYEDDIEKFFKAIRDKRVVLLVSPAIKTAFPETWNQILRWIKQEGVYAIYDMSIGGDICTWATLRSLEQGKIKNAIASHCPPVVNYITTYRPDLVNELSPVYGPAACAAVYIRTYLKVNYSVAVLTPCVGAKSDMGDSNLIDFVITFKRLEEHLSRKRVHFQKAADAVLNYDFEGEPGVLGSVMVRPAGLRDNLWVRNPDLNISAGDGVQSVYDDIIEYGATPDHVHPAVYDGMSCEYGCSRGPGMDWDVSRFEINRILHEMELEARSRRKTGIMNGPDKQFKQFDDIFNIKSFMRTYKAEKAEEKPALSELNPAFESMGKTTEESRKINCGACGNKTCRDMAESIFRGCNIPDNCIMFAQSTLNGNHREMTARYSEISDIAGKVSDFATKLLADIENIYASLYNIDDSNRQSQSRSSIVRDILSKIIGFCENSEYIDENNLPILVSTLEKLQTAMESLNYIIDESAANSTTIKEAMQEVADATTELNVMVHEMLDTTESKY